MLKYSFFCCIHLFRRTLESGPVVKKLKDKEVQNKKLENKIQKLEDENKNLQNELHELQKEDKGLPEEYKSVKKVALFKKLKNQEDEIKQLEDEIEDLKAQAEAMQEGEHVLIDRLQAENERLIIELEKTSIQVNVQAPVKSEKPENAASDGDEENVPVYGVSRLLRTG